MAISLRSGSLEAVLNNTSASSPIEAIIMPTKRDPTPVSVSKSVICLLTLRGSTFVEYSRLNMRSDFLCFGDSLIGGSIDSQSYIEG